MRRTKTAKTVLGVLCFSLSAIPACAELVNIYSYRQVDLIQPLLDKFTKETGIKTQVQFLNKGLAEKLEAQGRNSPADLILTTDIGRLSQIALRDISQAVNDDEINQNIPESFRDSAGKWFGLTLRGRVVFASQDRVEQDAITYEELADEKWKGRICTRSGQHPYNIALFASMIANKGEDFTLNWLKSVKENLARKPDGNDRAQAKAIFSGQCDIGIGNTYYVGLMINNEKKPEQKEWAASIKVLFPNMEDRGTHVNVSGMALAKHAPHKQDAIKLMQFLASQKGQEIYAEQVYEYPVKPGAKLSNVVAGFGELKADDLSLEKIAELRKKASLLVDESGYDDGPS